MKMEFKRLRSHRDVNCRRKMWLQLHVSLGHDSGTRAWKMSPNSSFMIHYEYVIYLTCKRSPEGFRSAIRDKGKIYAPYATSTFLFFLFSSPWKEKEKKNLSPPPPPPQGEVENLRTRQMRSGATPFAIVDRPVSGIARAPQKRQGWETNVEETWRGEKLGNISAIVKFTLQLR